MSYDAIYQAAFEDELAKIAGIPRWGIADRSIRAAKEYLDKEVSRNKDEAFRKSKLFRKWNKAKMKELRALKKYWRKRSVSTEIMGM